MSDPRPPSGLQIERSVTAHRELTDRLSEDPTFEDDEAVVRLLLNDRGVAHPDDLLKRLIDACAWTERRAAEADELHKEMRDRRDRYRHRSEQMRATIVALMEILGHRKITAPMMMAYTTWQKLGPVKITDANKVPDRLCKIERTPLITLIREAIEDGEVIDGIEIGNPGIILTLRKV